MSEDRETDKEQPNAAWDTKALDVARQFTHANETQRRAQLQLAVLEAMQWAAPVAQSRTPAPVAAQEATFADDDLPF